MQPAFMQSTMQVDHDGDDYVDDDGDDDLDDYVDDVFVVVS